MAHPLHRTGSARGWLGTALGAFVAVAGASPAGTATATRPFLVGGTQVHERDHGRWTSALGESGLNTVAVTVYAKQGAWNRAHLWWAEEEPAVVDEIRAARAKGLAVVLVLRVALDHAFPENRFLWHGMILPATDEELRSWFEQYGRFVETWARIAQREGVDVLGIGSELKALAATLPQSYWGQERAYWGFYWYQRLYRERSRQFAARLEPRHLGSGALRPSETLDAFIDARFEANVAWAAETHLRAKDDRLARVNARRRRMNDLWLGLIARTRRVYDGALTYAANFDNYRNVGFWPQLDLVGINSYFSLRGNLSEAASRAEQPRHFAARWREVLGEIRAFKAEQGIAPKPFLFTELGYTFRRHSTVEPWAYGGFSVVGWKGRRKELVVWDEQPVDYEERHLALEALRAVHREGGDDFAGILYWKLSSDKTHEAIEPFVVHVGRDTADPAAGALARFAAPAGVR
jgi:hypothetical protein